MKTSSGKLGGGRTGGRRRSGLTYSTISRPSRDVYGTRDMVFEIHSEHVACCGTVHAVYLARWRRSAEWKSVRRGCCCSVEMACVAESKLWGAAALQVLDALIPPKYSHVPPASQVLSVAAARTHETNSPIKVDRKRNW